MSDIKYERHLMANPTLPFIFHDDIARYRQSGIVNWHDNTEFLHCTHGEGFVNCDSSNIRMSCGDTVVINARCLHSINSDTSVRYHCLIVDNSFFTDNGIEIENLTFSEKINDKTAAEKMFHIALCMKENDKHLHIAHTRLAVLDYICYIAENYSQNGASKRQNLSKGYSAVLSSIEYINNHFSEKLSLEDISSRAGFSKYHFTRLFKENTGITVIEHINARRCDNASFLLRETEKPISEISFECGFDNPSYFAKAFYRLFDILPSEYRKKHSHL